MLQKAIDSFHLNVVICRDTFDPEKLGFFALREICTGDPAESRIEIVNLKVNF